MSNNYKKYVDLPDLDLFHKKAIVTEIIDDTVGYILATGTAKQGIEYYSRSGEGTVENPYIYTLVEGLIVDVSSVSNLYIKDNEGTDKSRLSAPSVAGVVDYVKKSIDNILPYTGGNAISINNNTVSVKYDNNTIKPDSNGNLVANVVTYQPFPSDFVTSGTLQQVVNSMLASSGAKQGMAYLGGIRGSCTPFGYGNVECKVEFMLNHICVLTVNSADIIPYNWVYNSYSGDYKWKKYTDVIPNPSGTTSNVLSKVSLDGTVYNIGSTVLSQPITTTTSIGNITSGETIPAGTSLEDIIRRILTNN